MGVRALLLLLPLLCAAPAVAESPVSPHLDETKKLFEERPELAVLAGVADAYRSAKTVRVDLTQTSSGPSYFDPLVQTGSFVVQKPDRIRWELKGTGGANTWISDGSTLWIVQPAEKTVQVFQNVSDGIRRYIGFLTGLDNVTTDFAVGFVTTGSEAVEGRSVLKLVPRTRDEQLKAIYVQVDSESHVVGVVIVTPFGDRTDMQLSGLKLDAPTSDDTFRWVHQEGWHVVPMD